MSLTSGTFLGSYEVLAPLGAGGMGEVYRARDTKLHREVALKILPEAFAADPERLARFTREAHTLAALNHPNIAAIYGLEDTGTVRALVIELVEGEDLSQRIARTGAKGLATEEALQIAMQIAEALEAAHDRGVVHRDLKPANIKVRADGTVKVLDFGLAKALGADDDAPVDAMNSPTITSPAAMTKAGVILGTAAYMSPEQARGHVVDARTDLWAFGCVLFEMLTGTRAFPGDSVTDAVAAVVRDEPRWDALPPATPAGIHKLLRRCLAKDRKRRMASASDARLEIEDCLSPIGTTMGASLNTLRAGRQSGGWAVAAALTLVLLGLASWREWGPASPPPIQGVRRSTEQLPPDTTLPGNNNHFGPALSPDGKRIAFIGNHAASDRLYVRAFDQVEATALEGTENAREPFFSPDGEWIAFANHGSGQLKKVNVRGGGVTTLAQAQHVHGGFWSTDGFIYYAPDQESTVMRIAASGGSPEPVTTLNPEGGEFGHEAPFLIDRQRVLLYAATAANSQSSDVASIFAQSLATGERKTLVRGGYAPKYLESGHLVFARNGSLWAAPLDVDALQLKGDPAPVLNGVASDGVNAVAAYGITPSGDLAYVTGIDLRLSTHLLTVDRAGNERRLSADPSGYFRPRFAPDGRRYAVTVDGHIEIGALDESTQTRFGPNKARGSLWTRDGMSIVYLVDELDDRGWRTSLIVAPLSGSSPRTLITRPGPISPSDVSPNGSDVVFLELDSKGSHMHRINMMGAAQAEKLFDVSSRRTNGRARFSPDGRWLAYDSDESGRIEVYVRSYPALGAPIRISADGGIEPRWARDGRELLFQNGGKVMAAQTTLSPTFKSQPPRVVLEGNFLASNWIGWDVTPDGERFLLIQPSTQGQRSLIVVKNWAEEVARPAPVP